MKQFPYKYFIIAFSFTWIFEILVALHSQEIIAIPFEPKILLLIGIFGPFVSAFYLTWQETGKLGTWKLFLSGFNFRISPLILLFIAILPILITYFATLLTGEHQPNTSIFSLLITFVLYFFLGGSFGEEFGWRGYALPILSNQFNPLIASLILGILWSFWHLPLFWIAGTSQSNTPFWIYLIYVTSSAFIYTWIYLKTKGNLLACLLFHTFTNITVEIFPIRSTGGVDNRIYLETLLIVIVAIFLAINIGKTSNTFLENKS